MTTDTPGADATPPAADKSCVLCTSDGGELLWTGVLARVVLVDEPAYPGFTRVICQDHVREMTDLPGRARVELMDLVWLVESVQREVLAPSKINVAALGNMVPHVHWHVIPRWQGDVCFPDAIWAPARRTDGNLGDGATQARARLATYVQALQSRLSQLS